MKPADNGLLLGRQAVAKINSVAYGVCSVPRAACGRPGQFDTGRLGFRRTASRHKRTRTGTARPSSPARPRRRPAR